MNEGVIVPFTSFHLSCCVLAVEYLLILERTESKGIHLGKTKDLTDCCNMGIGKGFFVRQADCMDDVS